MGILRSFILAVSLLACFLLSEASVICDDDLVCEHGVVDEENCGCRCSSGWWGDRCDDKCIDDRGENACKGYAHLCNNTQYSNFVRKNCAATCEFCEKFGPGSEGFICDLRCSEPGGTVNAVTCTCECASGWFGEFCEDKCEDTSSNCQKWGVEQCATSQSVIRRCPAMCGVCEEFGPGSPGFVCLKDCVNGGTLIDTEHECRCLCAKGWEGDQCEVMCKDSVKKCQYDVNKLNGGSYYRYDQCFSEPYVYDKCHEMCGRCESFGPGSPGFTCTLSCLNNGTLINNATHCYCQCTDNYIGVRCEAECRDLKKRCGRTRASDCHNPDYIPYMKQNCPVTCGLCHELDTSWGDYFLANVETPRSADELLEERALNGNYRSHLGEGIEVVFLIDNSGSEGADYFEVKRAMLRQFIDRLDFATEGGIRLLFTTFAYTIRVKNNLYDIIAGSKESALGSLQEISFEGGETRLRLALRTVMNNIFAHSRTNARQVLYIMTDGLFAENDFPESSASKLQKRGIEVFALPTNEYYDDDTLAALTSYAVNHVVFVKDADDIPLPY
ncbi:multiple epidermal growth factor-like domains protein 10 [Lytechinus variegatus]|uniref:multiple epidermal growth factor-like domains protein 10 n=1 Tax=Lytechinus variegatus TaxID=7654 RepID=UPI001BB15CC0|nr:multiple epidermal growth factor-like domains protein 10 [Lytechinus variegatus]